MLKNDYSGQNCSVARALEAVGERWTLLIVRDLLGRARKFSELERRLQIPKNILTDRLSKLSDLKIVDARTYDEHRAWKLYGLTDKGRDLYPVISALMAWGDRHSSPDGAPVVVEHRCGHPVGHRLVCEGCGEPLDNHEVRAKPGPGWTLPVSDLP